MSSATGTSRPNSQFETVTELYNKNLFLQAYQQSREYWSPGTRIQDLSLDELILGLRLASRLGGSRLSRWLSREAIKRDPSHPKVRYFASHIQLRSSKYFDRFQQMEKNPELEGADPETQASWLAYSAVLWASIRDFEHAHQCLARAHKLETHDGWVLSCESDVLAYEDRWTEALKPAEAAWEKSPGTPYAARSLASCLLNAGKIKQAAETLATAAEQSESYELALAACWYLCALTEGSGGDERAKVLARARQIAERASALAPLADRETRAAISRTRLDIAELADDHAAMEHWAREAGSPFHRKVLDNLRTNPNGPRLRLPFRQVIQKHNECLPTSIGSAMAAMGTPIDAEGMAAELTFGGTAEWAAAEWLEKQGYIVRFFTAVPETAVKLINNGFAFTLTLDFDTSAHAVAAVGLDEAAGTLLVHDPSGFRSTEYLLEQLGKGEAPLGPKAMVACRPERSRLLDELLQQDNVATMTAREAHRKASSLYGSVAARRVVTELAVRYPSDPNTRLLQALQDHEDGHIGPALAVLQKLLEEFPRSALVRSNLLSCCRSVRNTALMRKTLADVIERGRLPGVQSQQQWIYPPADYVSEYADLLRLSGETSRKAKNILKSLIGRASSCASAWHNLGDLLWTERDGAAFLLSYRIAACLAEKNEHYARAHAEALARAGRKEEGYSFLLSRARRFGAALDGEETWITLIAVLEEDGYPKRALAAAEESLHARNNAAELLAFLVPFQARMGRWSDAETLLKRLQQTGNTVLVDQASAGYFSMRGELDNALEHAENWLNHVPLSMQAREEVVSLLARQQGADTAIRRAREWVLESPGHEPRENLYCRQLERKSYTGWKKYSVLLRRVKRNSEDSWAWRELAFCAMYDFEMLAGKPQQRLRSRIEKYLAECDRTAPGETATLRADAHWLESRGEWKQAVDHWLQAVEREPANSYSYRRLWDCSARLNPEERLAIWRKIESALLTEPGHSPVARELILLAADRFGVSAAEEAVGRWINLRPDDPQVVEAYVDLLLNRGHGRTDYERALQLLLPELERFPYHLGLRQSHANALENLGRFQEAEEVFTEIIRRHPNDSWSRIRLAWMKQRRGETVAAFKELEEARLRDPQNGTVERAWVEILIEEQRFGEAREAIHRALDRLPSDVVWRENAIRLLVDCGDIEQAVEVARRGVLEYPRGAYLWLLLARTLSQHKEFAAQGEIEACLQRSLSYNQALYEAADYLAMLLVEQRRYDEAAQVIGQIETRLTDPAPARGRLAWIRRKRGEKLEARQDMTTLLQQEPSYDWGWSVLLDWLEEDKAWDDARRIFADLPPEQRTNTRFRQRRLEVLAKAGETTDDLDIEWKTLLHDFPENESLHVIRYDALLEEQRPAPAAQVLDHIRTVHPDSPYVLARYVEVLAGDKNKEEAITSLMRLFFAQSEPSNWPLDYAWGAIKKANYQEEAYQRAYVGLREGKRATSRAAFILANYVMERGGSEKRGRQPYLRTWIPDRGAREILKLLKVTDAKVDRRGAQRAALLSKLSDFGYERLVVRHWHRHRAEVEAETAPWSQLGRALADLKMYRTARKVLCDWRNRKGVAMWMVTNYAICLTGSGSRQLAEVRSCCRDALAGLSHDHCARYLVYREAEACALLRDREALLTCWKRYSEYFAGRLEKNEWFEEKRRYLLADIPILARHLENNELRQFRRMVRSLRSERLKLKLRSIAVPRLRLRRWWWLVWIALWLLVQLSQYHQ